MQADEPTLDELASAYRRTGLAHAGVNLQTALNTPMFKTLLTRIAHNQRAKAAKAKQYWYQNI